MRGTWNPPGERGRTTATWQSVAPDGCRRVSGAVVAGRGFEGGGRKNRWYLPASAPDPWTNPDDRDARPLRLTRRSRTPPSDTSKGLRILSGAPHFARLGDKRVTIVRGFGSLGRLLLHQRLLLHHPSALPAHLKPSPQFLIRHIQVPLNELTEQACNSARKAAILSTDVTHRLANRAIPVLLLQQ
jgi:hypothetical protein